jgi:hypothetical protein
MVFGLIDIWQKRSFLQHHQEQQRRESRIRMSSINRPGLTQIPGLFNHMKLPAASVGVIKTPEDLADFDMLGFRLTSRRRNTAESCDVETIQKPVRSRKRKRGAT